MESLKHESSILSQQVALMKSVSFNNCVSVSPRLTQLCFSSIANTLPLLAGNREKTRKLSSMLGMDSTGA